MEEIDPRLCRVALRDLIQYRLSMRSLSDYPLRYLRLNGIVSLTALMTERLDFDVTNLSLTQVMSLWLSGMVYPAELETLLCALRRRANQLSSTAQMGSTENPRSRPDWD